MKIAILSFYSGINDRGVERWAFDLGNRLSDKFDIVVYQNGEKLKDCNYSVYRTNINYNAGKISNNFLLKKLFFDYQSLKVLLFVVKILPNLIKSKFDLIIPTDGGWEPAILRIITWLTGKKMIIVGHAGIGWDDAINLWTFPNYFVGLSTHAVSWAKKINPFVKAVYISDAVDINKFTPRGDKLKNKLTKPVILCVGALEEAKRIGLVIKAVSKIPNASLLIAGRGELGTELTSLGIKLLKNRFMLSSFSQEEMPKVYRSADLLISASKSNYSFEMVLIEGMACGLPVIVNSDPIRKEIVGDAGLMVDPRDTELLVNNIRKALEFKWGGCAVKQANKFSWDVVSKKYQELFEQFIKK